MGKINEFNQFIPDNDKEHCEAWTEGDVLFIAIGDGSIRLKGADELEQFISYLCETKMREIPL